MRSVRFVAGVAAICVSAAVIITPERAEARCATFQTSHNGTDLFNLEGGAKTAAKAKLMYSVEQWQKNVASRRFVTARLGTDAIRGTWTISCRITGAMQKLAFAGNVSRLSPKQLKDTGR